MRQRKFKLQNLQAVKRGKKKHAIARGQDKRPEQKSYQAEEFRILAWSTERPKQYV